MEQQIGKYKVTREIGKGGMGIVYKGIDPETQKNVAIKILPPTTVNKATVERFNREAHAMSKLKHPNLIEVYEVGMTKGQHFYAMEYIEGETLKSLIKSKGRLAVADCLNVTAQVADALKCLHDENMIHRDIKPGNIMITSDGRAKLMDFGLVQVAEMTRLTVEGSSVGTAEYMSPEQVSDDEVDSRTDIYSLGASMYEMLAGRPPFEGESLQAILMKHKYEKPAPLRSLRPDVPQELEKIVHKALSKDLPQRYQKITELINDVVALGGTVLPKTEAPKPGPARGMTSSPAVSSARKGSKKISTFSPLPLLSLVVLGLIITGYVKRDVLMEKVQPFLDRFAVGGPQKADLTNEAEGYLEKFQLAEEHYAQGRKFYRQDRLAEAIDEYLKAIELRSDYALYYKELAEIYEKMDDNDLAIRTWQDLLKYAPAGSYARQAQRRIEQLTK